MTDLQSDGWTDRGKEWLTAGCPPINSKDRVMGEANEIEARAQVIAESDLEKQRCASMTKEALYVVRLCKRGQAGKVSRTHRKHAYAFCLTLSVGAGRNSLGINPGTIRARWAKHAEVIAGTLA